MFIVSFVEGPWQTNTYVIAVDEATPATPRGAVVIDPGVRSREPAEAILARDNLWLAAVVCTHGHLDHVAAAAELADAHGVPVFVHPADHEMLTDPVAGLGADALPLIRHILRGRSQLPLPGDLRDLADGQVLDVAGLQLRAVHAPGHTPGSVVLVADDAKAPVVFAGDVLFAGTVGRVDLPGGSMPAMLVSLGRLVRAIPAAARILPGHGLATTMAHELAANPYLVQVAAQAGSVEMPKEATH